MSQKKRILVFLYILGVSFATITLMGLLTKADALIIAVLLIIVGAYAAVVHWFVAPRLVPDRVTTGKASATAPNETALPGVQERHTARRRVLLLSFVTLFVGTPVWAIGFLIVGVPIWIWLIMAAVTLFEIISTLSLVLDVGKKIDGF